MTWTDLSSFQKYVLPIGFWESHAVVVNILPLELSPQPLAPLVREEGDLGCLYLLGPLGPLGPPVPRHCLFHYLPACPTKTLSSFCLTYCSSPNLSALLAMEAGVADWSIPGMQAHRCRWHGLLLLGQWPFVSAVDASPVKGQSAHSLLSALIMGLRAA